MSNEDAVGDYALRLALTPFIWVHRRVETFELIDVDIVHRHMSVDFTLPPHDSIKPGQEVAVPLHVIAKGALRDFDIRDRMGREVPVFTRQQSVIPRGLRTYLGGLQRPVAPISPDHEGVLDAIIKGDAEKGLLAANQALGKDGVLARLFTTDTPDKDLNVQRKDAAAFLRELGDHFVLLACLPYEPGRRQVIKLSYDGLRARGLTVRTRLQLFLARFLSSFGLIRCFEVIDGLRVGLSASYHAEFVPPPDTYAAGTELLVYQTETRHDQTQTRDDPIIHTYGPPVVDPQEHRPHVNVDALEAATTSPLNLPRGVHGRLTLRFQARRESLVFPLLVAAVVITGTVWFVELRASTKTGIDGPTLAVLLVVPFALATYFVRSAENNYVTRMLRWVRITAAIPVLAGVFVIAAKGLGFLDVRGPHVKEVSDWTFDWAAHARWITVVSTGLLTVAWLAPMLMRNGRRIGNAVRCVYAWLSPRNDLGHPWPPPGAGYRS